MTYDPRYNSTVLLGKLIGADMNTTADQAFSLGSSNYVIDAIEVTNASVNLTTAAGGFYTGASKSGTAIVAAGQVYSALTSSTARLVCTLAATNTRRTIPTFYFSLTTGQGSAATADIYVYGRKYD